MLSDLFESPPDIVIFLTILFISGLIVYFSILH